MKKTEISETEVFRAKVECQDGHVYYSRNHAKKGQAKAFRTIELERYRRYPSLGPMPRITIERAALNWCEIDA